MRALPKMPFDTIIRYFLVFMETKKPNYSHSVNYLLKVSKVVMLIMTLIASSMNSIVKTFDETI
ncbi:Uncharacterised protein [Vibrio cholerae]|nr:Uncharacterised protein [Vibrio cholerae]